MPKPLPDDVRHALRAGQKVDAIRLLREQTGLGLLPAKAAVEVGLVPDDPGLATNLAEVPAEVAEALAAGSPDKAIQLLRDTRGLGPREARRVVERARQKAAQQSERQAAGLSPGELPRGGVSRGLAVALVLLVVVLAAWYLSTGV